MTNDTGKNCFATLSRWLIPVFVAGSIASAPSLAGDASAAAIEAGRLVADDRKRGNCYSCHQVAGAELAGNTAPSLVYMKKRFPDRMALRAQIADPRQRNSNTIMPPYGAHGILTEQEIDQLVDYVLSL